MEKEIIKTKEEIVKMLKDLQKYALSDNCNVFEEGKLMSYATNGLNKLNTLNANDNELVKMYDIEDVLYFEKVKGE